MPKVPRSRCPKRYALNEEVCCWGDHSSALRDIEWTWKSDVCGVWPLHSTVSMFPFYHFSQRIFSPKTWSKYADKVSHLKW